MPKYKASNSVLEINWAFRKKFCGEKTYQVGMY